MFVMLELNEEDIVLYAGSSRRDQAGVSKVNLEHVEWSLRRPRLHRVPRRNPGGWQVHVEGNPEAQVFHEHVAEAALAVKWLTTRPLLSNKRERRARERLPDAVRRNEPPK